MTEPLKSLESPIEKPEELEVGLFSIQNNEDLAKSLKCSRVACTNGGQILVLEIVCYTQVVKQVRSLLHKPGSKTQVELKGLKLKKPESEEWDWRDSSRFRWFVGADGYTTSSIRLQHGLAHALYVAKDEGFMPVMDDEAVWCELKSDRFTTPIVREWLPYIRKELERRNLMYSCYGHRTHCGVLTAVDAQLDEIVESGIKKGEIEIPKPGVVDVEFSVSTESAKATGTELALIAR